MIVKPFSFDFEGIVFWTCAVGAAGNLMLAGSIGLHETLRFCYRRTTSARGKDVFSFRSRPCCACQPSHNWFIYPVRVRERWAAGMVGGMAGW